MLESNIIFFVCLFLSLSFSVMNHMIYYLNFLKNIINDKQGKSWSDIKVMNALRWNAVSDH